MRKPNVILRGLAWLGVARLPVRITGHPRIRERMRQTIHARNRRDDVVTLSMAMVVGAGLVGAGLLSSPLLGLEAVEVRGVSEPQRQMITDLLHVEPGQNLLDVDTDGAVERIAALPWVSDVAIVRELPSTLVVRPALERPVVMAEVGEERYLVTADGMVIDRALAGEEFDTSVVDVAALPRIAVLAAPTVGQNVGDPAVRSAAAMASEMPVVVADWVVSYTGEENGDVEAALSVPRPNGPVDITVRLGRPEDVRTKAATVVALLRQTADLGYLPSAMDVRIPDRPVVTR